MKVAIIHAGADSIEEFVEAVDSELLLVVALTLPETYY